MNGNYHSKEKYYCISYSQEGFALKKNWNIKKRKKTHSIPQWSFGNSSTLSLNLYYMANDWRFTKILSIPTTLYFKITYKKTERNNFRYSWKLISLCAMGDPIALKGLCFNVSFTQPNKYRIIGSIDSIVMKSNNSTRFYRISYLTEEAEWDRKQNLSL